MNGSLIPLWPSLLPPITDQLWFTADFPKNEEAELISLEEELESEKMLLKEQNTINVEQTDRAEEEQDYDETEDDSYMGDAASDDVDVEPQSPPW